MFQFSKNLLFWSPVVFTYTSRVNKTAHFISQVELEGSTTTTSSPVQPPIARMAVDDGRLHTTSSVQTAAPVYSTAAPTSSTAAPAYPTAAPVSLTVAPANYTAGLANSTATSGNATAALRECLHPKDVNCKQATVSVRK